MKCPYCNRESTKVIDSRPVEGNAIRRRRQCENCGKRYTTYERIENVPLIVIKKDMVREPYNRAKIEAGIISSCHKRPISMDRITNLVNDVQNEIFSLDLKEISSTQIGEIVMDKLKDFDSVAYVRFASVYREFKDVNTFMDEIKKLLDK